VQMFPIREDAELEFTKAEPESAKEQSAVTRATLEKQVAGWRAQNLPSHEEMDQIIDERSTLGVLAKSNMILSI